MRRSIIYLLALITISSAAHAEFLGIKKASERVTFRLKEPLDSTYGIERKPDSVHIWIRCDTGTVASATPLDYKARSTTYPFADITNTPIDTTKDYGDTAYWFTGVLSNFGTTTMSQVTISVDLYTGKYYRTTDATYQVIADSLTYDLKQGRDSAGLAAKTVLSTGVVLAADAITAAKIAADAIGASEVATDAIGAAELAADAIGASEIATDAIGAAEIAASAITVSEAPNLDSATSKVGVGDGAIGAAEIAADAIGASELAADAIGASEIAVTAAREIADSTLESLTSNHGGAGSYGALLETNLDAAVSTRSTLAATDNIGINWGDVSNPTSTVGLTNTTVGTATNISQIGGTAQTGINLGAYLPALLDTMMLFNGYRTGGKAVFKVSANKDTLYIYSRDGTTLLFRTVFVHEGGAAGDPPDTSRAVGP